MLTASAEVLPAWLSRPGATGGIGALLDEAARAAEDLCRVVESFDLARFVREREAADPHTRSPRAVARHVVRAAHGYAHDIAARMQRAPAERFSLSDDAVATPHELRPALREAFAATEHAVADLYDLSEQELSALTFNVRWGPTYDPDMLLEHAVCHLLRHRRQLERWG
ncbi:MAG: hypothetical protein H6825_03500 [Planctomycetes bacterium]|nr:hypothetical protein [Planctomycetota bacterium]